MITYCVEAYIIIKISEVWMEIFAEYKLIFPSNPSLSHSNRSKQYNIIVNFMINKTLHYHGIS